MLLRPPEDMAGHIGAYAHGCGERFGQIINRAPHSCGDHSRVQTAQPAFGYGSILAFLLIIWEDHLSLYAVPALYSCGPQ